MSKTSHLLLPSDLLVPVDPKQNVPPPLALLAVITLESIFNPCKLLFVVGRHGQGVYTYQETGSQYKGTWEYGRMESSGMYIHQEHLFKGNFVSNKVIDFLLHSGSQGCAGTCQVKSFLEKSVSYGRTLLLFLDIERHQLWQTLTVNHMSGWMVIVTWFPRRPRLVCTMTPSCILSSKWETSAIQWFIGTYIHNNTLQQLLKIKHSLNINMGLLKNICLFNILLFQCLSATRSREVHLWHWLWATWWIRQCRRGNCRCLSLNTTTGQRKNFNDSNSQHSDEKQKGNL